MGGYQSPAMGLTRILLERMRHTRICQGPIERFHALVQANALIVPISGPVIEVDLQLSQLAAPGQEQRIVSVPKFLPDRVSKQRPQDALRKTGSSATPSSHLEHPGGSCLEK